VENESEMTHWDMVMNVIIEPGRGDKMRGMRELTAAPAEERDLRTSRSPTRR
jgi:hypothetical protein